MVNRFPAFGSKRNYIIELFVLCTGHNMQDNGVNFLERWCSADSRATSK